MHAEKFVPELENMQRMSFSEIAGIFRIGRLAY
jgi:hypothetical protein